MQYYKLSVAAPILGIKLRTLRQWIIDGKIKAFKYPDSRNNYIAQSEIDRMKGEN